MSANTAENLNNFPALSEMGIVRFHEISKYRLRQDGHSKDVLQIRYKRAKGSLLPYSRTYKFGRSMKTVIVDGGTATMDHTFEISPFLLKAVSELDSLVTSNNAIVESASSKADRKAAKTEILSELDQIDQLLAASMSQGDASVANARLASIRQHLNTL